MKVDHIRDITNAWLNSGEYNSDLTSIREEIMKESLYSKSESSTASIFENKLYYIIKNKTGTTISFQKEVSVNGIPEGQHKFVVNRGRLDSVVNNLVIEYKHYTNLNNTAKWNRAREQVEKYLYTLKKNDGVEYNAILTDGLQIAYFSFSEDQVRHSTLVPFSNKDLDIIIKAILNNNTKKFVPDNIVKDFSINHNTQSLSKSIAITLFDGLKNSATEKTKMLFEEWKTLMHLSVDDNGKSSDIEKRRKELSLIFDEIIDNPEIEYLALYSLQTTYAIIVKLIACKIVDKLKYNTNTNSYFSLLNVSTKELQLFFERIEDGYSYRNSNLINFLEGDFFSWYADKNQWSSAFSRDIFELIKVIDSYSAFSFNIIYEPIDIFKDLYMSIIPSAVRHSTGEYFTPKWLADYVVKSSIEEIKNNDWKAIDPCCGSGIFIISLIKEIVGDINIHQLSDDEKESFRQTILKRVYGIDINPLSVLSARVGYYLALQPFGNMTGFEIPIYLGDSAIIPQKTRIDNVNCYKYSIYNSKKSFDCILPQRFVKHKEFGKIMNELQACVNTKEPQILYSSIIGYLSKEELESEELLNNIKSLSDNLVDLRKHNWDGIWIRIIANFMFIARLSDFDIIIGNPPWVKWEHLPTQYANRIKELCDIKHIFSGQGQFGGTQLNICALISNVTASNWLKKDGILAFLMPDSILSQNSYEGFRNFYINYEEGIRLYLQKIDKWESPLRPFSSGDKTVTQDFNTYYYGYSYKDYKKGIPVKALTKDKKISNEEINKKLTYSSASENLHLSTTTALQLSDKSTAFSYKSKKFDFSELIGDTAYLYRTGVEFTPQEIYMLTGYHKSKQHAHYRFKNMIFSRSKYRVEDTPIDGWDLPIENIYPIVTSPKLSPFSFDTANQFCILPYSKNDTSTTISVETLIAEQRDLVMYLSRHYDMINSQSEKSKKMRRGNDFYALSKIGPYTFAPNIVAAKDNGKFCASVINKVDTPWGKELMPICVKHTIIISQDKHGRFIEEDESHYICGILNTEFVREYFSNNFKSNGISLNKSNIYIPLYNKHNVLHYQISKLSEEIKKNPITLKQNLPQIDKLYLQICKNR